MRGEKYSFFQVQSNFNVDFDLKLWYNIYIR